MSEALGGLEALAVVLLVMAAGMAPALFAVAAQERADRKAAGDER